MNERISENTNYPTIDSIAHYKNQVLQSDHKDRSQVEESLSVMKNQYYDTEIRELIKRAEVLVKKEEDDALEEAEALFKEAYNRTNNPSAQILILIDMRYMVYNAAKCEGMIANYIQIRKLLDQVEDSDEKYILAIKSTFLLNYFALFAGNHSLWRNANEDILLSLKKEQELEKSYALNNLILANTHFEDFDIDLIGQVLELKASLGDRLNFDISLYTILTNLESTKQYQEGLELADLILADTVLNALFLRWVRLMKARCLIGLGRGENALAILESDINQIDEGVIMANKIDVESQLWLGELYRARGEVSANVEYLQKAVNLIEPSGDKFKLGRAYESLAKFTRDERHYLEAYSLYSYGFPDNSKPIKRLITVLGRIWHTDEGETRRRITQKAEQKQRTELFGISMRQLHLIDIAKPRSIILAKVAEMLKELWGITDFIVSQNEEIIYQMGQPFELELNQGNQEFAFDEYLWDKEIPGSDVLSSAAFMNFQDKNANQFAISAAKRNCPHSLDEYELAKLKDCFDLVKGLLCENINELKKEAREAQHLAELGCVFSTHTLEEIISSPIIKDTVFREAISQLCAKEGSAQSAIQVIREIRSRLSENVLTRDILMRAEAEIGEDWGKVETDQREALASFLTVGYRLSHIMSSIEIDIYKKFLPAKQFAQATIGYAGAGSCREAIDIDSITMEGEKVYGKASHKFFDYFEWPLIVGKLLLQKEPDIENHLEGLREIFSEEKLKLTLEEILNYNNENLLANSEFEVADYRDELPVEPGSLDVIMAGMRNLQYQYAIHDLMASLSNFNTALRKNGRLILNFCNVFTPYKEDPSGNKAYNLYWLYRVIYSHYAEKLGIEVTPGMFADGTTGNGSFARRAPISHEEIIGDLQNNGFCVDPINGIEIKELPFANKGEDEKSASIKFAINSGLINSLRNIGRDDLAQAVLDGGIFIEDFYICAEKKAEKHRKPIKKRPILTCINGRIDSRNQSGIRNQIQKICASAA